MTRTLSAGMNTERVKEENRPVVLFEIALSSGTLYYCDSDADVTFDAVVYTAIGISCSDIEHSKELSVDQVTVSVDNTNYAFTTLVAGGTVFENKKMTIKRVFLDALADPTNFTILFKGKMCAPRVSDDDTLFVLTVVSAVKSVENELPNRDYSPLCGWNPFGGSKCMANVCEKTGVVASATSTTLVDSTKRTEATGWFDKGVITHNSLRVLVDTYVYSGGATFLFITDSSNHRIVKLDIGMLGAGGGGTFITYCSAGSGDNNLNTPQSIVSDGSDLYIADNGNHRIMKRKLVDGTYVSKIGSDGTGNDQFHFPWGLGMNNSFLFVADSGNSRIVKRRTYDLSYVTKIGTVGTEDDQFNTPGQVFVYGDYYYVCDGSNNRIVKRRIDCFESPITGFIAKLGSLGSGANQFNNPGTVCCDGSFLFITDILNHRIVKLDMGLSGSPSGTWQTFGSLGSGVDQFNTPVGICASGNFLYICDANNNRIVKLDKTLLGSVGGTFTTFGTVGSGNDQFTYPAYITTAITGGTGTFTLKYAFKTTPSATDAYTVRRGCDRTSSYCNDKHNNIENCGAFWGISDAMRNQYTGGLRKEDQ